MSETVIMHKIRIALSSLGARLFRNNCGTLQDRNGTWVKFGVGSPGGSDLIGWMPVVITPNMVGSSLAVFIAVEVKTATGRLTKEQSDFLRAVNAAGGVGFVAHSEQEAISQINQ